MNNERFRPSGSDSQDGLVDAKTERNEEELTEKRVKRDENGPGGMTRGRNRGLRRVPSLKMRRMSKQVNP
jgi:hypothetical protein